MASVLDVLKIAASDIGYVAKNDPEPGSKFGRMMADLMGESWLRGPSWLVPYCAMAVSAWLYQAGLRWTVTPSYNCDQIRTRAKTAGYLVPNKYNARPGDLVLYDWNGNGSLDHIGIVEKNCGSYLQTIEGNTSPGTAGSQSNGGGVWRRTRAWTSVACIVRPPYDGASSIQPQPQIQPTHDTSKDLLAVDGLWGFATTKVIQQYGGTPVDGLISSQWIEWKPRLKACTQGWEFVSNPHGSPAIKTVQKIIGATPDGIFGKDSINALIIWAGGTPDGVLDLYSYSVKQLQRWLNKQIG